MVRLTQVVRGWREGGMNIHYLEVLVLDIAGAAYLPTGDGKLDTGYQGCIGGCEVRGWEKWWWVWSEVLEWGSMSISK